MLSGWPGRGLAGITVNVSPGFKPISINLNKTRVINQESVILFYLREALVHLVQESAIVQHLDVSSLQLWLALFAYAVDEDVQSQLTPVRHLLELASGNKPHVEDLYLLLSHLLGLLVSLR